MLALVVALWRNKKCSDFACLVAMLAFALVPEVRLAYLVALVAVELRVRVLLHLERAVAYHYARFAPSAVHRVDAVHCEEHARVCWNAFDSAHFNPPVSHLH